MQDQWNQFNVYEVGSQQYGRPLSTVFADPESYFYDEDNDPTVSFLRYIDYRYLRFFYHPVEDKFCLISGWKDPLWTNAKVMRSGLDADDRDSREQIFGTNLIDIQQKSIFQLLMDEVSVLSLHIHAIGILTQLGFPPLLHLPTCQSPSLVDGPVLLLCCVYLRHICG